MTDDKLFSKTVRIDLMPEQEGLAGIGGKSRHDRLEAANWSTRKRQTAAAAAATRSRYEELLQSVYDAAVITSVSGRILEVNGRAVEFLRYDRAKLCSMHIAELLEGADESLMNSIGDMLEQERFALLQVYCNRRDGSSFPAEIAVSRLSLDKMRLCFFIRDISVRRRTEEMLRTEHTAVQTCGSGIAIADTDGLLGYVNPAFARLMGVDADSLLHLDVREVLGEGDAVDDLIASALSDEQTWMGEFELENDDGQTIFLQVSATCSRTADGVPQGIVFSLADITLRRQAEMELEARVEARTSDLLAKIAKLEEELEQQKA